MNRVNNADVYTDLNGLAALKNQARQNSSAAVKDVAKQFEAIFLGSVLKGMRDAKLADGISDNDQSKFYKEMYDQQLAVHLSGKPGVGLADLIAKQLGQKEDKDDDHKKMGLEDYLNRSSGSNKTIPHAQNASHYPIGKGAVGGDAIKNSEIFKAYIQRTQQAQEISENKLNISDSRPIKTAEDFIQQLYPYAEQAAKELGVEPKVLLAQAALETGWGRSVIKNSDGSSSFNLFNIKAGKSWQGGQAKVTTLEFDHGVARKERAGFRAYNSFQESFQDYVAFIKNNPRYQDALQHTGNSERYLQELQQAGYATDPGYARKIMGIYRGEAMAEAESQTTFAVRS